MDRRTTIALLGGAVGVGAFTANAAGEDEAAGGEASGDEATGDGSAEGGRYSVVQGDTCVPVVPLTGDVSVEELYGLHVPERWGGDNGATDPGAGPYYESTGLADLQRPDTTVTFLYDGPDGLSLVTVNDTADAEEGGAVTWTVENVPTDAKWVVKDDLYLDPDTGEPAERNVDNWETDGSTHVVDWTWGSAGTDGGALGPLGDDFGLTVDPAFNEEAAHWGEHYAEEPITDWQVLSFPNGRDSPRRTSLALDEQVTIRTGGCGGSNGGVEADGSLDVRVAVKPGSDRDPINPRSHGVVPVALLMDGECDPSAVDVDSLRFGPPRVVDDGGGAEPAHGGHVESIDGTAALVLHFRVDEAGFEDGDDAAKLVGTTDDGTELSATDDVTVVASDNGDDGDDEDDEQEGEDDGEEGEDGGDDAEDERRGEMNDLNCDT